MLPLISWWKGEAVTTEEGKLEKSPLINKEGKITGYSTKSFWCYGELLICELALAWMWVGNLTGMPSDVKDT